ncbi:MAG: hypothetical protein ACXABD_03810 [Candidatus Thorarchaeota archaeon]|jgi:hypothetical protein
MNIKSICIYKNGRSNRLKMAKRAGKKLTHEKPIKDERENWFINKGNKLIKN